MCEISTINEWKRSVDVDRYFLVHPTSSVFAARRDRECSQWERTWQTEERSFFRQCSSTSTDEHSTSHLSSPLFVFNTLEEDLCSIGEHSSSSEDCLSPTAVCPVNVICLSVHLVFFSLWSPYPSTQFFPPFSVIEEIRSAIVRSHLEEKKTFEKNWLNNSPNCKN